MSEILRAEIEKFAEGTRFKRVPPDLTEIAIQTAVEALSIWDQHLLRVATELDNPPASDVFATADRKGNSIIEQYELLSNPRKTPSYEYAQQLISMIFSTLRQRIASRLVRRRLAIALGYDPQFPMEVAKTAPFQDANDYCWQAVRSLNEYSTLFQRPLLLEDNKSKDECDQKSVKTRKSSESLLVKGLFFT